MQNIFFFLFPLFFFIIILDNNNKNNQYEMHECYAMHILEKKEKKK